MKKPFRHFKEAHNPMAIQKRSTTIVFGKSTLYLRLPRQEDDAIMHRTTGRDVHLDVLAERDNEVLPQVFEQTGGASSHL